MGRKKTEVIDISVDELALSLVGWQVEEAQARLVTESQDWGDPEQHLAVSATFRFLSEDWTDRFMRSENGSYAPTVYIALNRHDAPAPSSDFNRVFFETIQKVKKGLIRVSAKSEIWTSQAPLAAKDLDLRLTAYDLDDVSGRYGNSEAALPSPATTPLEIIVMDETSVGAPRPNVTIAHAFVSKKDNESTLTVHTEGTFQFGGSEDLLKVYRDRHDWVDRVATVKDSVPFEVAVPEIRLEILDCTGFLLDDRTCDFGGHIPVDYQGNVPGRQPRWIGRTVFAISDLPGDPHRVVVRVTDGDR